MSRRVNALAATASTIWPCCELAREGNGPGTDAGSANGDLELEFR